MFLQDGNNLPKLSLRRRSNGYITRVTNDGFDTNLMETDNHYQAQCIAFGENAIANIIYAMEMNARRFAHGMKFETCKPMNSGLIECRYSSGAAAGPAKATYLIKGVDHADHKTATANIPAIVERCQADFYYNGFNAVTINGKQTNIHAWESRNDPGFKASFGDPLNDSKNHHAEHYNDRHEFEVTIARSREHYII